MPTDGETYERDDDRRSSDDDRRAGRGRGPADGVLHKAPATQFGAKAREHEEAVVDPDG